MLATSDIIALAGIQALGASLQGGLGYLSNAATNAASAQQAWEIAAYNQEWNQRNQCAERRWQERMANTQYQRTVKDMMAAGLNPMLLAGGFSPSSVPLTNANRSTAVAPQLKSFNPGEGLGNAASAFTSAYSQMKMNADNNELRAPQIEAETNLSNVSALETSARAQKELEEATRQHFENQIYENDPSILERKLRGDSYHTWTGKLTSDLLQPTTLREVGDKIGSWIGEFLGHSSKSVQSIADTQSKQIQQLAPRMRHELNKHLNNSRPRRHN